MTATKRPIDGMPEDTRWFELYSHGGENDVVKLCIDPDFPEQIQLWDENGLCVVNADIDDWFRVLTELRTISSELDSND